MRAPATSITGAVGQTEVRAIFERFGWAPLDLSGMHDIGLDQLIQVRDARRWDVGSLLGAQIKAGASRFGRPVHAAGTRDVIGWWYREEDEDHFDTWATAAFPVLLVLYDDIDRLAYWVHVTAESVKTTKKGETILVPSNQQLDAAQIDDLLRVAA